MSQSALSMSVRSAGPTVCRSPNPLLYLIIHRAGAKVVKSSIMVFLALIGLSPVLKTLTAATSSDSIWALSACLFVLNALLADYRKPEAIPRKEGYIYARSCR